MTRRDTTNVSGTFGKEGRGRFDDEASIIIHVDAGERSDEERLRS